MRGGAPQVVVVAPADGAVVGAGAPAFVWRPVPGARRYVLEVFSADGTIGATLSPTTDTTAILGGGMPPGDYRWTVRADMDGGTLRSPARRLRFTR